jgi:hypothetical protein
VWGFFYPKLDSLDGGAFVNGLILAQLKIFIGVMLGNGYTREGICRQTTGNRIIV